LGEIESPARINRIRRSAVKESASLVGMPKQIAE